VSRFRNSQHLNIAVILGSTRRGRFGKKPARWIFDELKKGPGVRPELSDLLLGRAPGRSSDSDITLFFNYSGLGYQFAATGHVIYKKARELGLGRELDTALFTSALPS